MTIATTNSVAVLEGNGVTTEFPVAVKFLDNDNMVVTITDDDDVTTDLIEGTGDGQYQLTGAGDEEGGTLTYPMGSGTVLPSGWVITVKRVVPLIQSLDLTNQSGFFLETIEAAFDNTVMMIQQIADRDNYATLKKNASNLYFDAEDERISNIAAPTSALDAVRLSDLSDLEQRFLADSEVAFTYWNFEGTGTTDYDIDGATTSEAGAYDVLLDNVRQRPELDYTINIGATPPQINFMSAVDSPTDIYIIARGYNSQVIGGTAGSWDDLTDKPSTFPPSTHTHDYSLVYAPISHAHGATDLPNASTGAKGVVQLSTSLTSTSTALAATASAVKQLKDLIDGGGSELPVASTVLAGIVQLENSVASSSVVKAATPASVKAAYDAAVAAQSTANGKAAASHNHNSVYAAKVTITRTTSTSAPTGGSDGDVHYIYE